MAFKESTLLDLRGQFHLPELSAQGLVRRLGPGFISRVVPIDQDHLILHTATSVFLYFLPTREMLWEIDCPSYNFSLHTPRNLLALAPEDGTIALWDLRSGQQRHQLVYSEARANYPISPNGLEFNRDGSMFAVGMESHSGNVITLWNTEDGQLTHVLPLNEPYADITTLAFHPTSNVLASGSFNHHKVWFWNLDDGRLIDVWEPQKLAGDKYERDRPYDLAFSRDGKWLFAGWGNWGLRIWDVEQHQEAARPLSTAKAQPSWLALDPGGNFLAIEYFSHVQDRGLRVYEMESWRVVYEITGDVSLPAFSPDGQLLAVSPSKTDPAFLVDVATWQKLEWPKPSDFFAASLAFPQPVENMLATSGNDKIRLLCTEDGSLLHEFVHQERHIGGRMAFSPDRSLLAATSHRGVKRSYVDLWSIPDGKVLFSLEGHTWTILALAFSPDGRILASGSADNTLRFWDLESKQEMHCCEGHLWAIKCLAFTPDGAIVAAGSLDKTLSLWNVEDGKRLCKLSGHQSGVISIAFSPDGRVLVSGDEKGDIYVWNVAKQKQIGHLQFHTATVNSLAFSSDGRFLVSGSDDGTVRFWDYAHEQEIACLRPYQGKIHHVGFTPDGRTLVTGAVYCVRFWQIEMVLQKALSTPPSM